jgi:hypothetical protein
MIFEVRVARFETKHGVQFRFHVGVCILYPLQDCNPNMIFIRTFNLGLRPGMPRRLSLWEESPDLVPLLISPVWGDCSQLNLLNLPGVNAL